MTKVMKMKKILFVALFLVLGLEITLAQVKLSFNPEKGAKYEYQTEMIQNIKQSVMGQEIPMETEVNMTYLIEIKDKMPQEIHVHFAYKDIAYIISNPMMKMKYDSKNPADNPSEIDRTLERVFRNLINKPFLVVITPDGTVKSVTELDAGTENTTVTSSNWQVDAQIVTQINQQFSGDAMKSTFEQLFKIYPTNTVKVGDSWNIENMTTMNNMSTNVKTRYTLKEISRNIATVIVESDMEMDPGTVMEGKLAGTQIGTMTIDTETGLPLTNDMSQNVLGLVKAQGMEVQMEMTGKVKGSIKELK